MTQRKPIISARRNDKLEAMLQKLWRLRPELEGKQAGTIMAGVSALLRETERTDSLGAQVAAAPTVAMPEPMAVDETAEDDPDEDDVSTDVEWDI